MNVRFWVITIEVTDFTTISDCRYDKPFFRNSKAFVGNIFMNDTI